MSDKKIIVVLMICIVMIIVIIALLMGGIQNAKQLEELGQEETFDEGNATLEKEVTLSEAENKSLLFTVEKYIKNTLNIDYNIYIWKLYVMERMSNETYFAETVTNRKEILYFVINIDNSTGTYSVQNISKEEYEDSIDGTVDEKYLEDIRIRKTGSNDLEYTYFSDEQISNYYLEMIKDLIINYPQAIYARLNDDYKKEKFNNSYDEFARYCVNRKNFISQVEINGFAIDRSSGTSKIYSIRDKSNNVYTIMETSASDFTILLDEYTIYTEDFVQQYASAKNSVKVTTNVDKFIKMINNKDYETAYKLLDETYKNNRFPTKEYYEQYLINEFYAVNSMTITKLEEQGTYYLVTFDIIPGDRFSSDTKTKQIAMRLGEGMDFTMSIILD